MQVRYLSRIVSSPIYRPKYTVRTFAHKGFRPRSDQYKLYYFAALLAFTTMLYPFLGPTTDGSNGFSIEDADPSLKTKADKVFGDEKSGLPTDKKDADEKKEKK